MNDRLGSLFLATGVVAGVLCAAQPASAEAGQTVDPRSFGAVGDGIVDDTAAVQRALDATTAGRTLVVARGRTYRHTDVLQIRNAGSHVSGSGVLLATNEARSSVWIMADDVVLDGGLVLRTAGTTRRWVAYEQMGLRLAGTRGTVLRGIRVQGAAAAGVYVGASTGFRLEDVRVWRSRADGIHMTEGSSYGTVLRPRVAQSGDDGVAVVSYAGGGLAHDIQVVAPVVRTTTWGRGLSVVGGEDITFSDVDVDASSAAGVYLATEGAPYFTQSTRRVSVLGGILRRSNTNATCDHGAVLVYGGSQGRAVEDVRVEGLTVLDTRTSAPWQVGVLVGAGSAAQVSVRDLTLVGGSTPSWSNAPGDSWSSSGWTWNGAPVAPHAP